MQVEDIDFVSATLRKRSGNIVGRNKAYLLESRLAPLARREGFEGIDGLLTVARDRRDERLLTAITDAMTTNETSFFRDRSLFAELKDRVLPDLARRKKGHPIRILCAGCSTGQEPYSIAMMLEEDPGLSNGSPVEIIGSDISARVLKKAKAGTYSQFEVQRGLPVQLLLAHFSRSGDLWTLSEAVRSRVAFARQNLLEPFADAGTFDIVLCRNVLIYFDLETKRKVVSQLLKHIEPGGYLVTGNSETLGSAIPASAAARGRDGVYQVGAGVSAADQAA